MNDVLVAKLLLRSSMRVLSIFMALTWSEVKFNRLVEATNKGAGLVECFTVADDHILHLGARLGGVFLIEEILLDVPINLRIIHRIYI